jgi:glycosyltransferase involved in cell wall biosynthesis
VIYEAVDERFSRRLSEDTLSCVREKYKLPKAFLLLNGGLKSRKNIGRMIHAFKLITQKIPHMHLVITGAKKWKSNQVRAEILRMNNVRLVGFVEEKDLSAIYQLSSLFVYPSLYEGFGLPILEAQASGCAVVCSNVTSLPEVARESVEYCDPYNVEDIARAIMKVLNDETYRKELIGRGYENIKRFDWDRSACEIIKVMRDVSGK